MELKTINNRQITEIAKSIASKKMSDYKDLTVGDFFADAVRPLIELMGVEIMQPSIEAEQAKEIEELKKKLEDLKKIDKT